MHTHENLLYLKDNLNFRWNGYYKIRCGQEIAIHVFKMMSKTFIFKKKKKSKKVKQTPVTQFITLSLRSVAVSIQCAMQIFLLFKLTTKLVNSNN